MGHRPPVASINYRLVIDCPRAVASLSRKSVVDEVVFRQPFRNFSSGDNHVLLD
jgi:hypothetical protein